MMLSARDITVEVGSRRIVDGASLDLASGEIVGLIGPNGAGKSTLLRAMVGLRGRSAGSVRLGEQAFEAVAALERARRVAYLPQERRVEWRLTVADVVMLGRFPHQTSFGRPGDACETAVERALERVDALALRERIASTLSAGELARVLLARALAVEAPILLVDEPIASLDPYHQLHVLEILQAEARRGAAVLVIMHDLQLAVRFMDRLVLMSEGAIAADGPPAEVLTPEMIAAVYHVTIATGRDAGPRWVIPWSRLEPAEDGPQDDRSTVTRAAQ